MVIIEIKKVVKIILLWVILSSGKCERQAVSSINGYFIENIKDKFYFQFEQKKNTPIYFVDVKDSVLVNNLQPIPIQGVYLSCCEFPSLYFSDLFDDNIKDTSFLKLKKEKGETGILSY